MNERLIVVLGGGESGVGAAILAQKKGFKVFLSDSGKLKDLHRETLKSYGIDLKKEDMQLKKFYRPMKW